ncbi:helix-turn-helix transcriptional regulator [Pelotalea chapellei]|uniref:Helix-turn-helix domain-containing protein n=1 Tax=Pelotalea chapellei TaxID=44671 RepID=A0ABS5U3R4_9BACT|nr:helix-turn-helix domain-containing protein [Pelotalea chapellei]MBT1070307.1 helix-turn-helix domain-containing protein [Pelotalea chapellei]
MNHHLYTVKSLREFLQIGRSNLYDLIKKADLKPTYYIGKSPRWTHEAVENWLSMRTKTK